MATTSNLVIKRSDGQRNSIPVAASTQIYEGSLVFIDSNGRAVGTTATGANKFAGVAVTEADNSAGSAGDINVEVFSGKEQEFEWTLASAAQSDVEVALYASDNNTVTKTSTNNTAVGVITAFVATNTIRFRIDTV